MPQTSICRMCLVTDVRMFTIAGTPLQAIYEKITEAELLENMKPVAACYICHAQLRRSLDFMLKAVKADEALTDFLINNKLTVKSVGRIDRTLYKLHHSFTSKVEIHDNTITEEDDEPKVKKETSFEFVADDHMEYDDHTDFLPLNEPDVEIDDKTVIVQPDPGFVEVDFMKEEKDSPVSDGDDNRDMDSEDERPLTKIKAVKRKHEDGEWRPPKKQPGEKKTIKKARAQKQFQFTYLHDAEDSTTATKRIQSFQLVEINNKWQYLCRFCDQPHLKATEMRYHLIKSHKPVECAVCHKRFGTIPTFRNHAILHTGEKPFQCDVCHKKFAIKQRLKTHLVKHSGVRKFQCNICGKTYAWNPHLKLHLLTHGEKPYQCDICKCKFSQKGTMRLHVLRHGKEKPYQCSICSRKLAKKKTLEIHMRLHTGYKPYECVVCTQRFNEEKALKAHLKRHSTPKFSIK